MNAQNLLPKAAILIITILVSTCAIFAQEQKNSNTDLINKAEELFDLYDYTPPTPGVLGTPELTPKESWDIYYKQQYQNAVANGIKASGDMTVKVMPTYYVWPGEAITLWGNVSWDSVAGTGDYYWDFGDGDVSPVYTISDARYLNATHNYDYFAVYYATLVVTDDLAQTEIETVQIIVTDNVQEIRRKRAIEDGLRYLYLQQYADGHWYGNYSSNNSATAANVAATSSVTKAI